MFCTVHQKTSKNNIRDYPAVTQHTLEVLMFGTYRGPSGTFRGPMENLIFWKQQLLYCIPIPISYWRSKYFKVLNGDSTGHLQDPVAGRPLNQIKGSSRSQDFCETSSLNSDFKHIELTFKSQSRLNSEQQQQKRQ